jgi:hypothetical protein
LHAYPTTSRVSGWVRTPRLEDWRCDDALPDQEWW